MVERSHSFYRKPDWIYDAGLYRQLTETQKDVLESYCRRMNEDNECYLGLKTLNKETGHWKKGIIEARKKLEKLQILALVGRHKGRGGYTPVYRISFNVPVEGVSYCQTSY